MAKTISSLNVVLGATVAPFVTAFGGAGNAATGLVSKIENVGSAVLKLTGVGLALGALSGAFDRVFAIPGEAFAAAERQSNAETRLAAVLKATGGAAGFSAKALTDHAAALQKTTTFGDEAIIEFQSVLATFRNISGDTFNSATSLALDMAAVMGTDVQSAAVQLGKALNDPVEGVTALRRVGVSFTEQQLGQIKAMQDVGNVAGAQAIVLSELKSEFGGAAEAMAKTPFGRFKQIGNEIGDMTEQVGNVLATVSVGFADAFNISGAVQWLSEEFAGIQDIVQTGVATYAPMVATAGAAVWSAVVGAVDSIYGYLAPTVGAIFGFISDNWQGVFESTVEYFGGVYDFMSGTLTGALAIVSGVWDGITTVWNGACDLVGASTSKLKDTTTGAFQAIVDVGKWLYGAMGNVLTSLGFLFAHVVDVVQFVGVTVALAFVSVGNEIAYVFSDQVPGLFRYFIAGLKDLAGITTTVLSNIASNAIAVFANLPGLISGTTSWSKVWTPLTEGFESAFKNVPEIAARQKGPMELALAAQAGELAGKFGQGLEDKLAASAKRDDHFAKAVEDTARRAVAGFHAPLLDIVKPTTPAIDTSGVTKPLAAVTQAATAAKASVTALDAVVSGSADSMKLAFDPTAMAATTDVGPTPIVPDLFGNMTPQAQAAGIPDLFGNTQSAERDGSTDGIFGSTASAAAPPTATPATQQDIQAATGSKSPALADAASDTAKLVQLETSMVAMFGQFMQLYRGRQPGATPQTASF